MISKTKGLDKETQDEMVGVLTAISIVSKKLAITLAKLGQKEEEVKKG